MVPGLRNILTAPEGSVEIVALPGGWSEVTLRPNDPAAFLPRASCRTSLPIEVIDAFLAASFTWLCDSLARHDDPEYVGGVLREQLFAYVDAGGFRGKRLLDFGCGSGASTLFIGTILPETEIVGVELDPRNVDLARRVLDARGLRNVQFHRSPSANSLPPEIGSFDFVMMSAVYEHLLPLERRLLMPLLWATMNPGGILFINQTPYRYFPYEHHSTGLWLINYLPDSAALYAARHWSRINREANRTRTWAEHLRGGIRGGTEGEILRDLRSAGPGTPTILQPCTQDRAAYWLARTGQDQHRGLKQAIAAVFRVTDRLCGTVPSMNLDVAIRKDAAR